MTANNVTDYPELCKALSSNKKIVYFCGAGVSMSLGGHNLSWTNWLLAGKQYLRHEQQAVFESLLGTKTTEGVAQRANYSEYDEDNQMKDAVELLKLSYSV